MTERRKELTAQGIYDLVGSVPTMLEIGCNDGTDTLKFLEAMPGARIYCFEPDPRAIIRFKKITDGEDRIELAEVAVSDTDGTTTFYGSSGRPPEKLRGPGALHYHHLDEWDLSGSLRKPTGHLTFSPWTTFPEDRRYQVGTIRLDTWKRKHLDVTHIDFIWCDVQGAESLVVQGGPETLKVTDYLYMEYSERPLYEGQAPLEELQFMLPGFDLIAICGSGRVEHNALFKNQRLM
ncbi:hypothetical protein LCGC14_0990520 [marine sediment metagenome]|uniref:Methyltransferase FkbM domain-containing protein n=1 Tax=marine sediment metagenome TaxID=412755 RepID=A0A0F9RCJ6_9ZZZZ